MQALQHLGQLDENANEVTSSEALKTIQKIQLQVQPPRVHGELRASDESSNHQTQNLIHVERIQ